MKKEIILCDVCGVKNAETLSIQVDRTMDGAGSMENIYEQIDLCPKHVNTFINNLIEAIKFSDRIALIKSMKKVH